MAAACKRHGKSAGILLPALDDVDRLVEMGFRFIATGADGSLLANGMKANLARCEQTRQKLGEVKNGPLSTARRREGHMLYGERILELVPFITVPKQPHPRPPPPESGRGSAFFAVFCRLRAKNRIKFSPSRFGKG